MSAGKAYLGHQYRGSRPWSAVVSVVTVSQVAHFLAIGHDNVIDILRLAPLSKVILNAVLVVNVEETAFWFAEQPGEVLNRLSFCWRVDDAEHFLQMVLDQLFKDQAESETKSEIVGVERGSLEG